jgi:hypothetical protein
MQGELRVSLAYSHHCWCSLPVLPSDLEDSVPPIAAGDPTSSVAGLMQEGSTESEDGLGDEGGSSATGEQSNRIVIHRRIERNQCKILQPSSSCCMFNNCSNLRYSGPLIFC